MLSSSLYIFKTTSPPKLLLLNLLFLLLTLQYLPNTCYYVLQARPGKKHIIKHIILEIIRVTIKKDLTFCKYLN